MLQGLASDWYLEKLVLSRPKASLLPSDMSVSQSSDHASFADDKEVVYFAAHSWLNTDFPSMKIQGNSADVVFNYSVAVVTADCMGAGTDASIGLEFQGEHGKSGFRTLEQSVTNELNLFERGKTNKFAVKLGRSLGLLKACNISMKATGMASLGVDWCLDTVIITDETSKEVYPFPNYRWLAPSDGIVNIAMSHEINECAKYSNIVKTLTLYVGTPWPFERAAHLALALMQMCGLILSVTRAPPSAGGLTILRQT